MNIKKKMKREDNFNKIALFDMDGVLCDYEKQLAEDLEKLRAPCEKQIKEVFGKDIPPHVKNRMHLIKNNTSWWASLPKYKLGWDIFKLAKKIGFRTIILSKNPGYNPEALTGKKIWVENNMGKDMEVILTADKGVVYGRILVDDYPEFAKRWLEHRPNGIVIMPESSLNKSFKHPQVIKYNGRNIKQVQEAMKKAYSRIIR